MYRTLLSTLTAAVFLCAHMTPASAQTPPIAKSSRSAAKPSFSGTININTASATALEALPGIGAKTAALIVEYRQKNGPFKKVEELMNIRGVGEKSFLKLRPQITVAAGATAARPEPPSSQQ